MKKTLSLFIVLLFSITCFAQTHMQIMGIDINGSTSSFAQKITAKGFHKIDGVDADYYSGKFAGWDCHLLISSTTKSHIVYKVGIVFNNLTHSNADVMRANLIKKYGDETSSNILYDDKTGITYILTEKGEIHFYYNEWSEEEKIRYDQDGQYYLIYFDHHNGEIYNEENFSDL